MSTTNSLYDHFKPVVLKHPHGILKPIGWLRNAWGVMAAAPAMSAALGISFTLLCLSAFAAADALPLFTATFFTLLLVVSPFLAAAAYAAAMQVASGDRPTFASCARSVAERSLSIGLFATLCALITAAWVRLTGLAFVIYYGTLGPSRAELVRVWFSDDVPLEMMLFLGAATLVLAAVLFTVAAIALPKIVDQNSDVVRAASTGLRVLKENPVTIAAWSVVLLVMIGLTMVSQLLLMPLVFPLLAYATWFSYAELTNR